MTKTQAISLFGKRPIDLARALGLTKQAINSWSDPLTKSQRDRVQAELYRRAQTTDGTVEAGGADAESGRPAPATS